MRTVLALSPHLDDAVFSAGATLWVAAQRGWRTIVATVFTGNVERPTGFALACQLDKGLSPDVDYMALRREEDRTACALLGAEIIHLPLLEAPHRGYDDASALFASLRSNDPAIDQVETAITKLLAQTNPQLVLAPLGIGGHVDHLIVRNAVARAARRSRLRWWEDWPYVDRAGAPERCEAGLIGFSTAGRAAKIRACASYETQLPFQFGAETQMEARLAEAEGEWLHRSPLPSTERSGCSPPDADPNHHSAMRS